MGLSTSPFYAHLTQRRRAEPDTEALGLFRRCTPPGLSSVQARIPVLLKPGRGVVLVADSEGGRGLLCILALATRLQHRVS